MQWPAKDQHVPNLISMWNVISGLTINHKLMGVISMGILTVANIHTGYQSARFKLESDRRDKVTNLFFFFLTVAGYSQRID